MKYSIREQNKEEAESLIRKAKKLMKERKLMEASQNLNKVLDILMNVRKLE